MKKKVLMVCEAFGGGVFTYVSQLCNDMVDSFDVYLAYSLRSQTPKNYKEFLALSVFEQVRVTSYVSSLYVNSVFESTPTLAGLAYSVYPSL